MKPAQYWREKKKIRQFIGRRGQVIASTIIRTSAPGLDYLTPYSYAVVDFAGEKKEMMGVSGEALSIGDEVVCVMRKTEISEPNQLINYGLKVQKVTR